MTIEKQVGDENVLYTHRQETVGDLGTVTARVRVYDKSDDDRTKVTYVVHEKAPRGPTLGLAFGESPIESPHTVKWPIDYERMPDFRGYEGRLEIQVSGSRPDGPVVGANQQDFFHKKFAPVYDLADHLYDAVMPAVLKEMK